MSSRTHDGPQPALRDLVELDGRVAVVTGAGQGIGAAVAARLFEAGAKLALVDRNVEAIESVQERLVSAFGRSADVLLVEADLSDPETAVATVVDAAGRLGGMDILVNNAGISPRDETLEMTAGAWRRVLGLNLDSAFFCAQAAARHMIDSGRRGVIVNMVSSTVHRVSANPVHYRASKAGLVAVTESLAAELGRYGIRVVAVAPTLTETPRVDALREAGAADGLAAYARRLPLGRTATADEVARVVLFAVSDLAAFVTGTVLDVDGGDRAK